MRLNIAARLLMTCAVTAGLSVAVPAAARADFPFQQGWNSSASYRASLDFIPTVSSVTPYGKACAGDIFSGDAWRFNISILRTSGSTVIWTSSAAPADGVVYQWSKVNVSTTTSYYFRWRGLDDFGNPYFPAPCQYVAAGF